MKIGEKTFVALSYQLKVDGQVVETVKAESPLQFVYGTGFLLPAFEANLAFIAAHTNLALGRTLHEQHVRFDGRAERAGDPALVVALR